MNRMIRKISLFILFSKKMRNCSKPCFQKLKRRNPKKKKKQKELEKDSGNAPLPSTNFLSYRFPSIPEEEKWGDVWQLYNQLIATEHRASVVHKFSYFSDERVPPKVVDKRSASWRGRRRGEEGIWYIELWYRGPSSLETRDWSRNGSVEDRAGVNMWKKIAVHVSLPISRQILLLSSSFSSSPLLFL